MITSGWSAAWDIAIVEQLKSSNKFRYGNYFTFRGRASKEIEDLANYRKGILLSVKDADSFFTTLADDMNAMVELHTRHPLTKELAVAKLKKHIVTPEGRIQLHDMLIKEADDLYQFTTSRLYPAPSWPAVKNEIIISNTQSMILAAMLVNGIYWGEENHHELWLKTISKFLYTNELPIGNGFWWKFRNYPPLYLFYAMGVGAVLVKDFKFLAKLLNLKIFSKDDRHEIFVIKFINNYKIFERNELNTLLGNNDNQPMSRFLLAELKIFYKDFIVNDRDYEDAFDYFEYALTLIYLTKVEDEYNWMPLGYYAQKMADHYYKKFSIVIKKQAEAASLKDQFELTQQTLFDDYSNYNEADKKFIDWIKDIRFM